MRFLLDESVDAPIASRLRQDGHEVICVWESEPGISDEMVLAQANEERVCLITADKDFGNLVFRMQRSFHGIILLRLAGLSIASKCDIISQAIANHQDAVSRAFLTINSTLVRIRW